MKNRIALCLIASSAIGALSFSACEIASTNGMDAGTTVDMTVNSYTVGGNVTSLTGSGLVLQLNGAGDLPVSAFGPFTFQGKVATGATYAVTVKTQPTAPAQTCTVMSGSGTMGTANVTNVVVACSTDAFKVGGNVSGLNGTVVLQNNAGDDLSVTASGPFTFVTPVAVGASYAVTVKTHPANQICTVALGSGSIANGDVSNVAVTCGPPTSCKAILGAIPGSKDGMYMIDPDGPGTKPPLMVFCDMTTDSGGYTTYQVTGGISVSRFDQANSCDALGLKLVIPRTKAHFNAMYTKYGAGSFAVLPGVYGKAAGNYTGCAMNSKDAACAANWVALDGGAWFARDATFSEPNGDYTPGCWLSLGGPDGNGNFTFNDANCNYATGTSYICSDNAK